MRFYEAATTPPASTIRDFAFATTAFSPEEGKGPAWYKCQVIRVSAENWEAAHEAAVAQVQPGAHIWTRWEETANAEIRAEIVPEGQ